VDALDQRLGGLTSRGNPLELGGLRLDRAAILEVLLHVHAAAHRLLLGLLHLGAARRLHGVLRLLHAIHETHASTSLSPVESFPPERVGPWTVAVSLISVANRCQRGLALG